ncbi:phage tail tape measure protein [Lactobacillus melliventris]|uniref:Phage tape measure protein n=1 Tax=Lactobacillus melliventris TaxID=1218507 RepID=A0A0F4LEC3_9LACO|nr:phage tail tape measure protein [Lactobacillus melliventris]KJY56673.1 Phage tape measure protein [Lactobacillus melliventris]
MADYTVKAIITAVDKGFTSTLDKSLDAVKKFGSQVQKNLEATGKAMTIVGGATTAMGIKSLKSFGDFEASLNKAAVVAGGTAKDINKLAEVANHMGAVLPISAQEASDAMVEMARNGASVKEIIKLFPAISQAATAAGADLTATAGVVQQAMNIWGSSLKSPQQAAAILVQTANASNASIEDMGQALATVGGTAGQARISMGTISEAIGLLTNRGFSAAQASMDLNHALLQMMAPSAVAQKAMNHLGITFTDNHDRMKPFKQILLEVADATNKMGDAQKTAALKSIFGTAGMQAILPLLQAVKNKSNDAKVSWDAYSAEQDKVASSTAKATVFLSDQANEMQQNIGSKIEQVGGNWEALRNKAMAAAGGVNGSLLDMINKTLDWATESNDSIASVIRSFVGLSPIIGPIMTALGTFFINLKNIGSALKAIASPAGIAIAAVVALGTAFVAIYNKSATLRDAIQNVINVFSSVFGPTLKSAGSALSTLGTQLGNIATTIGDTLGNAINSINWQPIAQGALTGFTSVSTYIKTVVNNLTSFLQPAISSINWSAVGSTAQSVFNSTKAAISTVVGVIKSIVSAIKGVISGFQQVGAMQSVWSIIGNAVKIVKTAFDGIVSVIGNVIKNFIKMGSALGVWQALGNIIGNIVKIISSIITVLTPVITFIIQAVTKIITFLTPIVAVITGIVVQIVNVIVSTITGLVTTITSIITTIQTVIRTGIQVIAQIISTILTTIVALWKATWNTVKSVATTIWNGIKAIITTAINAVKTVVTTVVNVIKTVWTTVWNAVKTVTTTVWNGIKSVITTAIKAVKSVITTVVNGIKSVVTSVWNAIKSVTSTVWNTIKSVITTAINGAKSVVTTVVNGIKSTVTNVWNTIKTTTTSTWNKIKSTVTTAVDRVKSTVEGMVSVGEDFVNGMIKGIGNAVGNLINAARNMARRAINAAKSALSINSPSRVMRDEVGYYFVAGMAKGISQNTGLAVKAAAAMASSAVPEIDPNAFNNQISALNHNAQSVLTGSFDQQINVKNQPAYINLSLGNHDYEVFVNDISKKQDEHSVLRQRRL